MHPTPSPRFEDVTETTGIPLTGEAASMLYTRYVVGSRLSAGRRVLELACGAGHGLGLLGTGARSVVGGDYSAALLASGRAHYGARFPLAQLSAEALPFAAGSFEVVLFFEASYYVPDMDAAFDEITRVLAPGGTVLFVNANPERIDFIRSPHSRHYHTADELRVALQRRGFGVSVEGGYPVDQTARGAVARVRSTVIRLLRRVLERLRLVPRTLRGRARLKRLIYGKAQTVVPAELPERFAAEAERVPVRPGPVRDYKVLYVRGDRAAR